MRLLNFLRNIKNRFFIRPLDYNLLRLEIDADRLRKNIAFFKRHFKIPYLAVVLKSNAYGHGLKEISQLLDKNEEVSHFIVDSLMEAKILRNFNIKKDIIILGYLPSVTLPSLKKIKNVILVVNSLNQAELIKNLVDFPLKIHIKIDTGFHRQGIYLEELTTAILILQKNKNLKIEGLLSHLADAPNQNNLAAKQIQKWQEGVKIYKRNVANCAHHFFHILATTGINYFSKINNNLVRLGAGIYGIDTTPEKNLSLEPVISLWAKVVNIKRVKAGERVGYGFSWIADKDTKIAIIPCGYYEGVPRYLSNKGYFYYYDMPLKIVGKVCMNLTMVDVSDINGLKVEDEIEIISNNPSKLNSVYKIAEMGQTIPLEVLTHFSLQIRRVVKNKDNY